MKYLVLVGDGMADYPRPELDGRTPLEAASTPAMDEIAARGLLGTYYPIPDDLPPGSDIGNLSLFGYDPHATFTGRAPIEAARQGIPVADDQVAFRCNLVTLRDGIMASFTAGHIPTPEATQLIEALASALGDTTVAFHSGVSYRHLTILTAGEITVDDMVATSCTPPHDISDRLYEDHLPAGPAADYLRDLMARSQAVLASHAVNAARIASDNPPATSIWLWGQGKKPTMTPYVDRFGLSGAVISAVDLVNGIGVCAGFEVIEVPGATGYLDTDYAGKVNAALGALERHALAYLHVEAPDEVSHEGSTDLKIQAIEDFDRQVVSPCLDSAIARGDSRLLVAPDHVTAIETKTHAGGPVPFAACGPGISPAGATSYSEAAAAAANVVIPRGHLLLPHLLTTDVVTAATLASIDG